MSDQLFTVATFNFTTEPNFLLFKLALERHGIPYYAANENTVNADPFLSISVGGIRVQVHEDDWLEAITIWREIKELDSVEEGEVGDTDRILDGARTASGIDTTQSNRKYQFIVGALLLYILLRIFQAVWRGFSY